MSTANDCPQCRAWGACLLHPAVAAPVSEVSDLREKLEAMTAHRDAAVSTAALWRKDLEDEKLQKGELLKFVAGLKDEFCGWTCPSVWKTADGQPHDKRCIDLRTFLGSADKQDLCGCGVPGCNKRYDHRR